MTGEVEHDEPKRPLTEDQRAELDRLLAKWGGWVRRLVTRYHRLTLGRIEYEELYGDVVVTLVARFPTFDQARGSFSTFVALVAKNVACRAAELRSRRVGISGWYTSTPDDDVDLIVNLEPDPDAPEPIDAAARAEVRGRVAAAVDALPDDQRAVVRGRLLGEDGGRLRGLAREHLADGLATLRAELAAVAADR